MYNVHGDGRLFFVRQNMFSFGQGQPENVIVVNMLLSIAEYCHERRILLSTQASVTIGGHVYKHHKYLHLYASAFEAMKYVVHFNMMH